MFLNSDGLFPCEDKIEAVKAFKLPRTIKQLQSFLGLTGYYRKFIKDYSKIAAPLFKATKKGKKFVIDDSGENAFNVLKNCLTSSDFLIFPNFHDTFRLETDASDIGLGAVLSQKRDGEWKPIAYWSRQLIRSEQNYSATEKEALAIVEAMEHFHVYLYGLDVIVCTDHQPLIWMMNVRDPQHRVARWIVRLSEYSFVLSIDLGN